MNFNSVLIITYGRSGSTLLQGILNSIDGCLVRGENNNFCYHLFKTWQAINNATLRNSPEPENPWYGSHLLNERLFLSQSKNLLYSLLMADKVHDNAIKCYGFKEIRYTTLAIHDDFEQFLDFLQKVFPKVAFVFNTRSHTDVARSKWWAEMQQDEVHNVLNATEANFFDYMKKSPSNTFHICYEDVLSKNSRLKELFDFLGANYDECNLELVLGKKHSY
ncbi:MAG: sulfotransferase [Marinilabiliaceae bacterium]|nr:sulfotransferase [Marinilabiliaceae bacterium]